MTRATRRGVVSKTVFSQSLDFEERQLTVGVNLRQFKDARFSGRQLADAWFDAQQLNTGFRAKELQDLECDRASEVFVLRLRLDWNSVCTVFACLTTWFNECLFLFGAILFHCRMEVTIVDAGALPAESTVVSLRAGSVRKHAQVEKGTVISIPRLPPSEDVHVDFLTQLGTCDFEMESDQGVHDVVFGSDTSDDHVSLKLSVRLPTVSEKTNVTTSPKLHTALLMRNYLDTHDVVRQMEQLVQDMSFDQPQDPLEYMMWRLEQMCPDTEILDETEQGGF